MTTLPAIMRVRSRLNAVASSPAVLRVALVAPVLAYLLITRGAWLDPSWSVPLLPLPQVPGVVPFLWASLLLSAALYLRRPTTAAVVVFLLSVAASVTLDLNVATPTMYYFAGTLALHAYALRVRQDPAGTVLLYLGPMYVWAGLHKFNLKYFTHAPGWAAEPFPQLPELQALLLAGALTAPLLETLIGVTLLFPRYRRWGAIGGAAVHAMALLVLGPLGHDWGTSVWPWNVGLLLLHLTLLLRHDVRSPLDPAGPVGVNETPGARRAAWVLVAIIGLIPVPYWLTDRGPYSLSFALYTFNTTSATVTRPDGTQESLMVLFHDRYGTVPVADDWALHRTLNRLHANGVIEGGSICSRSALLVSWAGSSTTACKPFTVRLDRTGFDTPQ